MYHEACMRQDSVREIKRCVLIRTSIFTHFPVVHLQRKEFVRLFFRRLPQRPGVAGFVLVEEAELFDGIGGGVVSLQLVAANRCTDTAPSTKHIPVEKPARYLFHVQFSKQNLIMQRSHGTPFEPTCKTNEGLQAPER